MSQNKTVIQGLEPADGTTRMEPGGARPNFYARNERPAARGTIVPGMMDVSMSSSAAASDSPSTTQQPTGRFR